nr:hypothetical protein GQ55_9G274100 [Tanacetum cinerariifolium]
KELYKGHCPSSLTRYCWIGLSPIVQDSPLLTPQLESILEMLKTEIESLRCKECKKVDGGLNWIEMQESIQNQKYSRKVLK